MGAGHMRSVLADVQKGCRILPLRPTCPHQHPRAWLNSAVLVLPSFHMFAREQEVWIIRRFPRDVDDAGGSNELLDRDRVGGVSLIIFARHPMYRRIEMGSGVLAASEIVPIPTWSALVVAGNLFQSKRPRFAKLLGQLNNRGARLERLTQIHHA